MFNDILARLALPGRFGEPPEDLAQRRYDNPGAILKVFGAAQTDAAPGALIRLFDLEDINAESSGAANQPKAAPDQFSITLSHGVYKLAPHLTRGVGFNRLIVNFKQDETAGDWRLRDLDFRRYEEDHLTTITPDAQTMRDVNRILQAAQSMVSGAAKAMDQGRPHTLDPFGEVIVEAASKAVAARAQVVAKQQDAAPSRPAVTPVPGSAKAA
ncbi:MAG: hypothetical protein AAF213_10590 [Pseudomonadota bacterium]